MLTCIAPKLEVGGYQLSLSCNDDPNTLVLDGEYTVSSAVDFHPVFTAVGATGTTLTVMGVNFVEPETSSSIFSLNSAPYLTLWLKKPPHPSTSFALMRKFCKIAKSPQNIGNELVMGNLGRRVFLYSEAPAATKNERSSQVQRFRNFPFLYPDS